MTGGSGKDSKNQAEEASTAAVCHELRGKLNAAVLLAEVVRRELAKTASPQGMHDLDTLCATLAEASALIDLLRR